SLKLSSVPPAGTDRFDCTNSALPNKLSATASACTLRLMPRGSVPVEERCQTVANESRSAVYEYDPAEPRVTGPAAMELWALVPTARTASFSPASASWSALAESPARRDERRFTSDVETSATISALATIMTITVM